MGFGALSEGNDLSLRFPSRANALSGVRNAVRERLTTADVDETTISDVLLAVGEACQNIIRHCYGDDPGLIELTLHHDPERIEVVLTDFGPRVDPSTFAGRDLDDIRPGGLGLHLIQRCMDEVVYEEPQKDEGNRLRMRKHLVPTPQP